MTYQFSSFFNQSMSIRSLCLPESSFIRMSPSFETIDSGFPSHSTVRRVLHTSSTCGVTRSRSSDKTSPSSSILETRRISTARSAKDISSPRISKPRSCAISNERSRDSAWIRMSMSNVAREKPRIDNAKPPQTAYSIPASSSASVIVESSLRRSDICVQITTPFWAEAGPAMANRRAENRNTLPI